MSKGRGEVMRKLKQKLLLLMVVMGLVLLGNWGYANKAMAATVVNAQDTSVDDICNGIKMNATSNQAVGTKRQLLLYYNTLASGSYTTTWSSSNTTIAKVTSKDGIITALKPGTAYISCVINVNGKKFRYSTKLTVTNPVFSKKVFYVKKGSSITLTVSGSTTKNFTLISRNNSIALPPYVEGGKVTGKSAGTVLFTADVDGRFISCKVVVSSPKLNYNDMFFTVGKSATLKVSGHSKQTGITYKSSNTKIATVSKTGYVKAKKIGSAVITVTVDGTTLYSYVGVGKTGVVNSLKRAYSALGMKYSQSRRMKKGYYDCSSLVWRSFSPSGYLFGNKTYAPTAASQAQYLVKKKKVKAYSGVSTSKLLPGDLVYLKGTSSNGRYKNISHVAIYIGNGRILHARDEKAGVRIDKYSTYQKRVVVIGRL